MRRLVGGQQGGGGQVVHQHAAHGGHGGRPPGVEVGEQRRGARPGATECAERHGQTEQAHQDGQAEHLERRAGRRLTPQEAQAHCEEPDRGDRQCGCAQNQHQDGDGGHRHQAHPDDRPCGRLVDPCGGAERLGGGATPTTAAVTRAAARPASAMWSKKARPERCRWPSTITLVRLEPGNSREPALARRIET